MSDRALAQLIDELSAILGAAYESFMLARLDRRKSERGEVHARTARSFIEWVAEMIGEAGGGDDWPR